MKPILDFISINNFRRGNGLIKCKLDAVIKIEESTKEYRDARFKKLMEYRWAYDYFRNHTKMNILDIMNTFEYRGDITDFNILNGLLTLQEFVDSTNSKNYFKNIDEITIALDLSDVDSFDYQYRMNVLRYFERMMYIMSQFDTKFRFNIKIMYSDEIQSVIDDNEELFEIIAELSDLEQVLYNKIGNNNEITWCILKSSALTCERKSELFERYLKLLTDYNNDGELTLCTDEDYEDDEDDIEEC